MENITIDDILSMRKKGNPTFNKDNLLNLFKKYPGTSFAEIMGWFPEAKGDLAMCLNDNPTIILWTNLSQEFMDIIKELLDEKIIRIQSCHFFVYLADGHFLGLPIAKRLDHHYKKPRWLPAVFILAKKDKIDDARK